MARERAFTRAFNRLYDWHLAEALAAAEAAHGRPVLLCAGADGVACIDLHGGLLERDRADLDQSVEDGVLEPAPPVTDADGAVHDAWRLSPTARRLFARVRARA